MAPSDRTRFAPNSPAARDIEYYLHPFTNLKAHEENGPLIINEGKGIYVYDDQGNEIIEGMAGLWCTSLGFGEERLAKVAYDQMLKLPYIQGFTHRSNEVAIDLAEKLISIAPGNMGKVFFTNSGSEANDTQIKIVWYYNNALGRPEKKKIIGRHKAYHGITLAAASLSGVEYAHKGFDVPLDRFLHARTPHFWREGLDGESEDEFSTRLAQELDDMIVGEGPETVAAFIAEPVMGAGGLITPPTGYFQKIQAVLKKHDVLMIADEVITGFMRTGNMFGCETYDIQPDLISVAKALSSAYLPIGGVMMTNEVYEVLREGGDKFGMWNTGYTYSGHPVSAAVALETLRIYEERDMLGHVRSVMGTFQEQMAQFADHPLVGEVRGVGLFAAMELAPDIENKGSFDPALKIGPGMVARAQAHGLIMRGLPSDSVALCPPLIINEDEIGMMMERTSKALDETWEFVQAEGLV
ncbi:MAG: aminotransferase [Alphaproteobacteria bacterium]|jgi:4-aminobutyrate--pyruvate transaminase